MQTMQQHSAAASNSMRIIDAKTIIYQSRSNRPSHNSRTCVSPGFTEFMQAIDNHLNHRPVKLSTPCFPMSAASPSVARPTSAAGIAVAPRQLHFQTSTSTTTSAMETSVYANPRTGVAKRTLRFSTESTASSAYAATMHRGNFDEEEEEDEEEFLPSMTATTTVAGRTGNGVSYAYSSPMRYTSPTPPPTSPPPSSARPRSVQRSFQDLPAPPPPPHSASSHAAASRSTGSFVRRFEISSQPATAAASATADLPSFASRYGEAPTSLASRFRAASAAAAAEEEEEAEAVPDVDADAEFARQLMEAEEAEFLERLHAEQARALAQLRSANNDGESWMQNISQDDDEEEGAEEEEEDMSYDRMLELGESLGDVKTERWRARSAQVLESFVQVKYAHVPAQYRGTDMCVICQFNFESEDVVKLMPRCTHCFHSECTDAWIKDHSSCATCKAAVE